MEKLKYILPYIRTKKEKDIVSEMLSSDVREINHIPKINTFLKSNSVFISLTTSPLRLKKIKAVLATLDLRNVTNVLIALPLKFGPEKKTYCNVDIQKIKKFSRKIKIIRVKKDLGPITKILPAIEFARKNKDIIISVDDDIAYPMGFVNELIFQKVMNHPNTIIQCGTPFFFRQDIDNFRNLWPQKKKSKYPEIDLVEGWSGVAYSKGLVDVSLMKILSSLSTHCYLSDDLVISYVLTKKNVKKIHVINEYMYNPHPFDYGSLEDALHRGRGLSKKKIIGRKHDDEVNWMKYKSCLKDIRKKSKRKKL